MPTKVRNTLQRGSFKTVVTPESGGSIVDENPFPSSVYTANGKLETIISTSTPNFRSRMKTGEIIMNPVALTKLTRECTPGSYSFVDGSPGGFGSRVLYGHWPIVWQTNVYNIPSSYVTRLSDSKKSTLLAAYNKVASTDVYSLVTVAEFKETASMLRRPFDRADKLLNKMIARKMKYLSRGFEASKAAANAWLEYRLGWKPLLYEIESYMKAYVNRTDDHQRPVRLTVRSSDKFEYTQTTNYDGNLNWVLQCKMLAMYVTKWKVSSGIIYDLQETNTERFNRSLGLRLADVPSTLWEATPLSFVVDRFVSVGEWLNAVTPKPGVTIRGSWTTVVKDDDAKHIVLSVAFPSSKNPGNWISGGSGGLFRSNTLTFNREPNPTISLTPVVNHNDLSVQQTLDHLSLLIAKIKRF